MKIPRFLMDEYEFRAQLLPAITISIPVVAFVYGVVPFARNFWGGISGSVLESAVLYLLMRISRDRGTRLQDIVFLGGMPTTVLLRWSDQKIDYHTKERYKRTLSKISGLVFPNEAEEAAAPTVADAKYASAVKALIERRRGKSYPLVFRENCNYGFIRNLVGLKLIGIIVTVLTFAADTLLYISNLGDREGIALSVLVSCCIIILLLLVTRESVKRTGYAYAYALLRTCDIASSKQQAV